MAEEELKPPDQDTYTIEELAKRWNWNISRVNAYIRTGQLKVAIPPAAREELFRYYFYRCSCDEPLLEGVCPPLAEDHSYKWLLMAIEDGEPLEKYVRVADEKIIRRKYLYLPPEDEEGAVIERPNSKEICYFYDLEGNALIQVEEDDGWPICFARVKKHHFDALIIPLEELKRFERESRIGKKGKKTSSVVQPKKERIEREQEDSDVPPPTPQTNDKAPNVPPAKDRLIDIKEVKKRVSWQYSTIHRKVAEGVFPQKQKRGKSTFWRESEINAYVAGTWKPSDNEAGKESDK